MLSHATLLQYILMNKEDTTRVRLVFANTKEDDILLRCRPSLSFPAISAQAALGDCS